MTFDGTEGEQISVNEAATLTANYRTANGNGVIGQFMGKEILNSILGQSGCVGIRSYYGVDSTGMQKIVMVGVDSNGNDMVTGIVADRGPLCPTNCSTSNVLNS